MVLPILYNKTDVYYVVKQSFKDLTWLQIRYVSNVNTLGLGKNCSHFTDDISKCILLNENVSIPSTMSLTFVPKIWINNIPADNGSVSTRRLAIIWTNDI